MSRNAARPSWFLLGGVTALGPLAMGVHVPGLGDIASALGETVLQAQLSVPAFIVAFGLGMFGAGDIVDRVGLRLALGGGLLTFILGALLAGSTTELRLLLVGRVLMGAGAAFAIVVPRAAVATDVAQTTNGLARLAAIQAAVPALAPLLGAALVAWLGWRATFLLPGAAAVALLVATILVLPKEERSRRDGVAKQASSYGWLGSRGWLLPTAEIALVTAVFLVLLAQTSTLLVRPFRLDSAELGIVLAFTGAAFVVGSVLLVRAKDPAPLQRASRVAFIGAMVLLAVGSSSVLVWAIGLVVYALANGVLVPAAFGEVAFAVPASKGRALGTTGAMQMLVGAAGGAAANSLGGLTPFTFGAGGVLVALTVLALARVKRGDRRCAAA
jgi:DHA1 family bicyclomycin/chloramphenicol resistance-like MFS transporter